MTSKLGLYKGALRALGETTITALTDTRPARYTLDEIWDDDFRDLVLQAGLWNFAMKTVRIEYTGDLTPDFGPQYAFDKPTDWIRTAAVSANEDFKPPLSERDDGLGYWDEQDYWFANYDTLYVKYVSNDENYGYDLSRWPANFTQYASHMIAALGAERITQNRMKKSDVISMADEWLSRAQNTDAMNQTSMIQPQGTWASSRMRGSKLSRYNGGWR